MFWSCFLSSFVEFRSAVSEEKSKLSQPIRGQGSHLVFFDQPEKCKLGRGCCYLAFCQVLYNSVQWFQRRSQKYLSKSEAGWPSCFSDRSEKHKLGRGRCDLAFCKVSLNSVSRIQRRSRNCEKLTTLDDGRQTTDNAFGSGALKQY